MSSTTKFDIATSDLLRRHGAGPAALGSQPPAPGPETQAIGDIRAVGEVIRRETIYRRLLVAGDAVAAVLAVVVTAFLWHKAIKWPIVAVAPLAIVIAKIQGLYDRDDMVIRKSTLLEWRSICQASAIVAILDYLAWTNLTSAYKGGGVRVFLFISLAGFVFTLVSRIGSRRIARALALPEACVIVAGRGDPSALAAHIDGLAGVELVGTVEMRQLEDPATDLRALVEQLRIHRLVIVPDGRTSDATMLELVRTAKAMGLRVSLFPTLLAAVGGCTVFDDLNGMTVLGVPRFGLSRSSRALKRAFDLVLGTLGLIVAVPVMALIALAIRIDSPGPALFRQTRVGRGGDHFTMLKFRTMVVGAESMREQLAERNEAADGLFKMTDDPRVTRFGALLRRSHLDELPQVINVLQGEMSLVGPRPLVIEEDGLLAGGDRYRLHLTPGMTGPWQIKGPMSTPLSEMAKLDYLYISNWSLWQDIDILLKTAVRVSTRSGH
jgi:exopolysaccharide biosynthesis polyprenyl glycosylphosphotransferase